MAMRNLTRKLFGPHKTTKISSKRPPPELVQKQIQFRSITPLNAKDDNEHHWPRIYEKAIKNGNPTIEKEDLKQQVAQLVKLRKRRKDERLATKHLQTEFVQQSSQKTMVQPQKSRPRSMYGPKTPVFALDTHSPLWPRFYEKKVRTAHPKMSDADVREQVLLLVERRRQIKDNNIARQKATMRSGGKKSRRKSRRKSRSLLSFFY